MEFGVGTRKQRSGGKVQLSGLILKPWASGSFYGPRVMMWSCQSFYSGPTSLRVCCNSPVNMRAHTHCRITRVPQVKSSDFSAQLWVHVLRFLVKNNLNSFIDITSKSWSFRITWTPVSPVCVSDWPTELVCSQGRSIDYWLLVFLLMLRPVHHYIILPGSDDCCLVMSSAHRKAFTWLLSDWIWCLIGFQSDFQNKSSWTVWAPVFSWTL